MKKLLAMLLAAAMTIGTASVALADDTGLFKLNGTRYDTLQEAVDKAGEGDTIYLLESTAGPGVKVASGKDFTIDFGGYKYTVNDETVGSTGTETNGFQILKGSNITMQNGTISAGKYAKILIQNYSNLELYNLTLDAKDSDSIDYVMSNNCGNVQIIGNSSIFAPDGKVAFDVCWAPNKGYPEGAQVTVDTTGTIDGTVEIGVWGSVVGKPSLSTFTVENGVFTGSLNVAPDLSESSKENVSVEGGLFTDASWNNDEYTENAEVIAELKNDGETKAFHIGGTGDVIDATNYDAVEVTKAKDGTVKVVGEDVAVENGTDKALTVNGANVPVDGEVVVNRAPREDNGGDYFGNEKWAKVKREIAAAEEGDTIEMSATGLPWFPSSVARALKGKDVTLEVRKNGVTYSVNGLKIGSIDKIWYEFDQIETELLTAEAE